MANYFNSINIGLRALQVQKKSLDVTGHNIANANNEGYSRQRVVQSTTQPHSLTWGAGQVGTGVKIEEIERVRDSFIDSQIREEQQAQGMWQKKYEGLHRIELVFNEPSDSSLNYAMKQFWNSLQDLSNYPEDDSTRAIVKQRAVTLVDAFHSLDNQLVDYKIALNDEVRANIDGINSLARRIADLNGEIVQIKGTGQNPNDLLDQRDLLFDQLNQIVNVQGREGERGNLNISIGGMKLVSGVNINELEVRAGDKDYEDKIYFAGTDNEADINSGELKGILDIRDTELTNYIDDLKYMAYNLKENFNNVHQSGYDLDGNPGGDFFSGAGTLENFSIAKFGVVQSIKEDPRRIAAGNYSDNTDVVAVGDFNHNYQYTINVEKSDDPAQGNYRIKVTETDNNNQMESDWYYVDDLTDLTIDDTTFSGTSFSDSFNFEIKDTGTAVVNTNPGNGDTARELADVLAQKSLSDEKKSPPMDYYKAMIGTLGVDGQRAEQMVDNQELLVVQLNNQQASISAVSLDEEMANMIKYQQAYNAAAKIISTTDQMLDSLMAILR